jgi:hypothetical protein
MTYMAYETLSQYFSEILHNSQQSSNIKFSKSFRKADISSGCSGHDERMLKS